MPAWLQSATTAVTASPVWLQTALLLTASNVFMTFQWYTLRHTCRVSQNAVGATLHR